MMLAVVGTRPQFIKAAAVMRAVARHNATAATRLDHRLVNTGQHYDWGLSAISFDELAWPADAIELGVGSGPHGAQTGRMLAGLEEVFVAERPGMVVVYGDTNSTVAAALAAAKLHIPVAHVEAGLRSYNRRMPEEINRVVTDHVSSLLFCPTDDAVRHLAAEGIVRGVSRPGDVMHASAVEFAARASGACRPMAACGVARGGFALATVHRAENTNDPARLRDITAALDAIAGEVPVVWPVHPRTRAVMAREGIGPHHARVHTIDSVSYGEMLALEQQSRMVLTDSGGVQREAYWFGVPCVTLRDETEWRETVASGWNIVAGSRTDAILAAYRHFSNGWEPPARSADPEPAADRIVQAIARGVTTGPVQAGALSA